jgi:hypothetical protein
MASAVMIMISKFFAQENTSHGMFQDLTTRRLMSEGRSGTPHLIEVMEPK